MALPLAVAACVLLGGCATHSHPTHPPPDKEPPPSTPGGECQRYRDAFEKSLRKGERSAVDSTAVDSTTSEDALTELLEEVASSPELRDLLACLSGSRPPASDPAR